MKVGTTPLVTSCDKVRSLTAASQTFLAVSVSRSCMCVLHSMCLLSLPTGLEGSSKTANARETVEPMYGSQLHSFVQAYTSRVLQPKQQSDSTRSNT
jgi:hypothetical protein